MKILVNIIIYFITKAVCLPNIEQSIRLLNQTRRILRGNQVEDTRPYMVYLRPSATDLKLTDSNWLCGGVIIHSQYVLTSAACIEDVQQFNVISGTHRWLPPGSEDNCIKNGAKRAVWKCVPKNYVFDGREFANIRWMVNDIAIVKVENDFNFNKRVRGCDFVPKPIAFNNQSKDLEASGTVASIAGWGSIDKYSDPMEGPSKNSPELLETDVVLISKARCKRRWDERYHYIIDESMICAKDAVDNDALICSSQQIECKELVYSDEDEDEKEGARRFIMEPDKLQIHSARHSHQTRRVKSGGFCENDHGGPLVVGHGKGGVVVGVISACMTANVTKKCYGPFLYTSVWHNRHVISCAIDKDLGATCRRLLASGNTRLVRTKLDATNHQSLREGPTMSPESTTDNIVTVSKRDVATSIRKNIFKHKNTSVTKKRKRHTSKSHQ